MLDPRFLRSPNPQRVPPGERVYAIGDVHGELLLLASLLRSILEDTRSRIPLASRTTIVLLGDIIDRGPDSAKLLRGLSAEAVPGLIVLRGNHEAALADAYHGDEQSAAFWIAYGGAATLRAFGVSQSVIDNGSPAETIAAMRQNIEPQLVAWLEARPTSWVMGDYYFVHAGIRPGVRLEDQDDEDKMWIRGDFLKYRRRHEKVIVHGHTIHPNDVWIGRNRIGLDTGGHEYGVLSSIGLQDDLRWVIQARRDVDEQASESILDKTRSSLATDNSTYAEIGALLAAILTPEERSDSYPLSEVTIAPVSVSPRWSDNGSAGMVTAKTALAGALAVAAVGSAVIFLNGLGSVTGPPPGRSLEPPVAAMQTYPARVTFAGDAPRMSEESRSPRNPRTRPDVATSTPALIVQRQIPDGEAVDPYAGRVAKPLFGAALLSAQAADRLATQELNRRQLEITRDPTSVSSDSPPTGSPYLQE